MPLATNQDIRIRYERAGAGPALLLIPGLGGGVQQLSGLAAALAQHYTVLSVDPRGAHGSDKPDLPYEGAGLADDMASVLALAATGPVHVVGISFGGMIAQQLALRAPHLVRSLVLASTYAAADPWSARMWFVRELLLDRVGMVDHFRLAMMFLFSPRVFREEPDRIKALEAGFASAQPDPVGYRRQLEYCRDHDTRGRLGAIAAPTLVVTGAEDILATPFQGRDLAREIPGALYREIPEAAHLFMLAEPAAFAALVRDFHGGKLNEEQVAAPRKLGATR